MKNLKLMTDVLTVIDDIKLINIQSEIRGFEFPLLCY